MRTGKHVKVPRLLRRPVRESYTDQAHRRLGRRGGSLVIYGLIWFISGFPLLFVEPQVHLYHLIALQVWSAAFLASGTIAMVAASKRTIVADRWGFIALVLVGSLWVVQRFVAWGVLFVHTGHVYVLEGPLLGGIVVALLVIKVNIDAGWSEPMEPMGHMGRPPTVEVSQNVTVKIAEDDSEDEA